MSTAAKKRYLQEQRRKGVEELIALCMENDIPYEQKNDEFQIRLDNVLDVYPTSRKYHIIPANRWGQYNRTEDLLKVLSGPGST